MDKYGISRCFMFCLDEPDRHPGFQAGNDRTLAFGERSNGRMIPFVRLDLAEDPIGEATRMLDRGARGIKLHPRAQKFLLNDERLSPIFEIAADRKVPILIHGGRGLPPIADDLGRVVDRNPDAQLIVAHAGIADLAALADRLGGKAGVFFDTSVWSPLDLLGLYRLVGPEQVLYASDYPYGQQPASLLISLRTARLAQLNDEQVRGVLAGNADRIADGEPPLEPSRPKGIETFSQPISLARIHQYLSMATPLLWTRQQDRIGVLGLALNACDDRANGHREELDQIRELLTVAQRHVVDTAGRRGRKGPHGTHASDLPPHPSRRHRGGDDACLSCASTARHILMTPRSADRSRRCCARTSASPARRSPAVKAIAAPAPCSSTACRPSRASRSSTRSATAR